MIAVMNVAPGLTLPVKGSTAVTRQSENEKRAGFGEAGCIACGFDSSSLWCGAAVRALPGPREHCGRNHSSPGHEGAGHVTR